MRRRALSCALLLVASTGAACSGGNPPSILDPAGPAARRVEGLWWPMLWISVAVFLIVAVMLGMATARRSRDGVAELDKEEVRWGDPFIAVAGVAIPFVILASVYVLSLREMNGLASDGRGARLTIEVIGHDWWWEARYPNGAETANEIHIPVGEPVELELTTADVIHSFWVPELQVKTDQIPGQTNRQWLQADEPGTYRGQCAEFCGLQHANMVFYVIADEGFDGWVEDQAQNAAAVATEGEELFQESSCAGCHAIRGTEAEATLGPDLTHIASRNTIAGVADMSRANMLRFVRNAQDLKPGATMPPAELGPDEVRAIVDYMMSLD